MKQESSRKGALQPGSQRRESKTPFFTYMGSLVQFQASGEWMELDELYPHLTNQWSKSTEKPISVFSILERRDRQYVNPKEHPHFLNNGNLFWDTNLLSSIPGDHHDSRSQGYAPFRDTSSVRFVLLCHRLPIFTARGSFLHLPMRNTASYQLSTIKVLVLDQSVR